MLPTGVKAPLKRIYGKDLYHMHGIDPELIQKFIENKCSRAEWDAVITFLVNHPEYEHVLFPEKEWNSIEGEKRLPGEVLSEMMKNIKAELFSKQQVTVQYYIKHAAGIAALFILVISVLIFYKKPGGQAASIQKVLPSTPVMQHDSMWIDHTNKTDRPIAIVLPDESRVTLQPQSVLKYNKQFGLVKRDVWFSGEALFQIARNEQKPFTVKTGSINITVLGTVFRVVTGNSKVNIHLYKGKVVVKAASHLPGWKGDTYLSPGDELSYNNVSEMIAVAKVTSEKTAKPPVNNRHDFDFNSASLKEVMDKLATSYHCKIAYSEKDIKDLNFTGTVTQNDSLTVILKLIANMNGLNVQLKGNNYIISKP